MGGEGGARGEEVGRECLDNWRQITSVLAVMESMLLLKRAFITNQKSLIFWSKSPLDRRASASFPCTPKQLICHASHVVRWDTEHFSPRSAVNDGSIARSKTAEAGERHWPQEEKNNGRHNNSSKTNVRECT